MLKSLSIATPSHFAGPQNSGLSGRLMSLDVFRGATIAAMILVNDAGDEPSSYWPLRHSEWSGWTPTDLVFPFFLFIMGVAVAFSLRARVDRGDSKSNLMRHVLWRGAILFAIGLTLNGIPVHSVPGTWRVYGVLQRIAICYIETAALALWFGRRGQVMAIVSCIVGYWILMRYVPVPEFGVPVRDIPLLDPDRNLAAWLDRKVLAGHLYEVTRDPEGILSTIPAIASSLLGLVTGEWLRSSERRASQAVTMAVSGCVLAVAGEILNLWFPINKKLWTSSYVLFTAGLALVCFALCYWILDVKRKRGWWNTPFVVFGRNAIAAYVLSEGLAIALEAVQIFLPDGTPASAHEYLYERWFVPLGSPANASLYYAVIYVLVCWAFMWTLYRQRIFLKV